MFQNWINRSNTGGDIHCANPLSSVQVYYFKYTPWGFYLLPPPSCAQWDSIHEVWEAQGGVEPAFLIILYQSSSTMELSGKKSLYFRASHYLWEITNWRKRYVEHAIDYSYICHDSISWNFIYQILNYWNYALPHLHPFFFIHFYLAEHFNLTYTVTN